MCKQLWWEILVSVLLAGCATMSSSSPPREEITQLTQALEVKATWRYLEQLGRVNTVGVRLLKALPQDTPTRPTPYYGWMLAKPVHPFAPAFGLQPSDVGVLIVGITPESPAAQAGLVPGDQMLTIHHVPVLDPREVSRVIRAQGVEQPVAIDYQRADTRHQTVVTPAWLPATVRFHVLNHQDMTAGASGQTIVVTSGLLRFMTSDDELAIVLGHELAHVLLGHVPRATPRDLLSGLIGGTFGLGSEVIVPGSGGPVSQQLMQLLRGHFASDLERAADAVGLRYAWQAGFDVARGVKIWERLAIEVPETLHTSLLSTHPTSAERLLRLETLAEELTSP